MPEGRRQSAQRSESLPPPRAQCRRKPRRQSKKKASLKTGKPSAKRRTARSAEHALRLMQELTCGVSCHRTAPADSSGRRLFLGGLPWETTQEQLLQHFAQFGDVVEAVSCLKVCNTPSYSLLLLLDGPAKAGQLLPHHICVAMLQEHCAGGDYGKGDEQAARLWFCHF